MMKRRSFILGLSALPLLSSLAFADDMSMKVFKSPTCGCCGNWVTHMKNAGFDVTVENVSQDDLYTLKAQLGISPELSSCHTAIIGDYFVEGHVPAEDVKRLLTDNIKVLGLTVPGMPMGSPGMEMGDEHEAFDTYLITPSGQAKIFSKHL